MKLEKFNYNEGKGKRMFLYGFILAVALMILINLFFSEAKYLKTESVKIVEGTISYKPYDFKIMAMYQENENSEYEEIDTMPTSGYVINEEKSYCTVDNINKDSNAILRTMNGNHIVSNLNKNDKCYIWFDKVSTIQNIIETHNLSIRSDFLTTLTEDTTGTLFMAPDDYGTSYYFAGAVQDNWIKFGGFYWRIIRINGDGTLRMIYSGSEESGPATTGEDTQIGISAFNENGNDNAYVGYKYTLGEIHGTGVDSTIKKMLDNWYLNNFTNYSNYIAMGNGASFCNDRTVSSGAGTGNSGTYYAATYRQIPLFQCLNSNDSFDTNIGLITVDEARYAGALWNIVNNNYFLYTNQVYWTMTPHYFMKDNGPCIFTLPADVSIWDAGSPIKLGVRPVINLRADTEFIEGGTGTASNPYVVK